jgi:hypothetical protein
MLRKQSAHRVPSCTAVAVPMVPHTRRALTPPLAPRVYPNNIFIACIELSFFTENDFEQADGPQGRRGAIMPRRSRTTRNALKLELGSA